MKVRVGVLHDSVEAVWVIADVVGHRLGHGRELLHGTSDAGHVLGQLGGRDLARDGECGEAAFVPSGEVARGILALEAPNEKVEQRGLAVVPEVLLELAEDREPHREGTTPCGGVVEHVAQGEHLEADGTQAGFILERLQGLCGGFAGPEDRADPFVELGGLVRCGGWGRSQGEG